MEQTTTRTFAHDDTCEGTTCGCAQREMVWVTREAWDLMEQVIPPEESHEAPGHQARWDLFTARKVALVAAVEAERMES